MSHLLLEADALHLPLPDRSADLVMGSPPYLEARTYGIGAQRKCHAWVDWMLQATAEAMRVSRGLVLWVVAGQTRDWCYQPSPEGLLWEWWKRGGDCHCFRPAYWNRVGIPGSGGKQWLRGDVEYVLAFKRPGPLPWADPTACGHPPKWGPGGEMSYRVKDGHRRNQWGKHLNSTTSSRRPDGTFQDGHRPSHKPHTKREPDGTMRDQTYVPPVLANPGNLIRTTTGGGQLGHRLAHENEAPYPEVLAEFFVKSFCPPGGVVLDPWSGSGTTASVAARNGRVGIGSDIRRSQAELASRRIAEQLADEARPHRPKPKRKRKPKPVGQLEMFGESA